MPTLRAMSGGLLALTSILVLTRSLSTMAGYNSRGLWRDTAQTTVPQSTQAEVLARMRRVLHERREATPSPPPPPDACLAMRRRHGVVPHVTWGTLPQAEQATWSVLGCDLQLEQQPTKTEPPKPVPETEPLKQHGAGDAPPAAVAAPVRNKTSSRGVPLWLEPSHTNLLFNSHAQAQLAPYEPARTTLHFTFGSAVMMDFVKNWLHFAKKAGLTPYLVGTADTGMGTVSVAIVSVP